ncbi:MAG: exosortase system-associated protein, TIGR04073 family [Proteobacteria bacterium]|nr:exosortase system-associated protein, TIGR04073 family [Pseudomonadota bacterium]MCZ6784351.1 exosortase system-associated protein, TIGR04073 family [Pseudomonadota bacterium]
MKRLIIAITLALFIPAAASAGTDRSYPVKIGWKFGRGLYNIVKAPVEIPVNSYKEARGADLGGDNAGGIVLGYIVGVFTGTGYMMARVGTGVFDMTTFFWPTEALMKPAVADGFFAVLTSDRDITNRPPRHQLEPQAHSGHSAY